MSSLVRSIRLPSGARMTSDGMRYSNIDPDHEISAAPRPIGATSAAQPEPMPGRHFAGGDRHEARKPRSEATRS